MLERKQLHEYQVKGVQHIIDNEFCALFLDMGLGKTVTTLTAIKDLLDNCIISICFSCSPIACCCSATSTGLIFGVLVECRPIRMRVCYVGYRDWETDRKSVV